MTHYSDKKPDGKTIIDALATYSSASDSINLHNEGYIKKINGFRYVFIGTMPLYLDDYDIFDEYVESKEFRDAVSSGKYVWVDGFFVLKPLAEFFIETKELREPYDTASASENNNLDMFFANYCLHAEYYRMLRRPGVAYYRAPKPKRQAILQANRVDEIDEIVEKEFSEFVFNPIVFTGFSDLLEHYIKSKNMTYELLSELTGIPDRTIRRFKNEPEKRPSLRYIIAICIGMHLRPSESEALVKAAGYSLRNTPKERAYQYLLDAAYNHTVIECNEFLDRMNFAPLTSI